MIDPFPADYLIPVVDPFPAGALLPEAHAVGVNGNRDQPAKLPFYPRLLQLKNIHPNALQRALLGEGMTLAGLLLSMADLASAWSILVLPAGMAIVVKAHDQLAGYLKAELEQT